MPFDLGEEVLLEPIHRISETAGLQDNQAQWRSPPHLKFPVLHETRRVRPSAPIGPSNIAIARLNLLQSLRVHRRCSVQMNLGMRLPFAAPSFGTNAKLD